MIQDFPGMVKFFASRNPVHLLMFVLPLWSFFLYYSLNTPSNALITGLLILSGGLYWSFLEYVIHRYFYHTHFRSKLLNYFIGSFHTYHHQDMSDHRVLNAGFLMVYVVTPTVLSPLLLFTQNVQLLASLSVGLVSAHYFYEWVHYTLHYKVHTSGYLNYIQKYHFHHHDKAAMKNFGNTSHIWDVVFGTYDDAYKNYSMSQATKKSLITEKPSEELLHAKA